MCRSADSCPRLGKSVGLIQITNRVASAASVANVDALRDVLLTLSPSARDKLRRVLILDQPDRDAIAELLRYGDHHGPYLRVWLYPSQTVASTAISARPRRP